MIRNTLLVAAFASLAAAAPSYAAQKPNVIIVFGDDIGHGDLNVFGHPTSRTPSLDRMARAGAKLTMYESAANVCSPSRASIMTGRYYTRTGAWPGVFSPNSVAGLPLNETTIAAALKTVGYTSGMVGKWHLGTNEFLPTNHGFDFYYGAPMTQNECTSNIKYPGSSVYRPPAASVSAASAAAAAGAGAAGAKNCSATYHVIEKVGLSSGGSSAAGADTVEKCCEACTAGGGGCAAWTFHHSSAGGKAFGHCVLSAKDLPHNSSGTQDCTSGSKAPIPPQPWGPPPPAPHGSGFGPCPIFNGSTGAVTEQYDLMAAGGPHLYDMLGIDEKYDAAAEGFIRKAVASATPFFFYFCSHHTHAPQFSPDSFLGYSRRGLHGDSLGLVDRSAGRLMNLTQELGVADNTMIVFSADNGGSLAWRELGGVNGDLRCGKGTTYEGGHRVPLIAMWPGRIPAGVIIDELTSSLDWFPTILNLAGAKIQTDRIIDGVDMMQLLSGTGPTKRKNFLYFEWRTADLMAVRIGQWKLHMQTRGSHCSAPFGDANCYDMSFRNASFYAPGGGGPPGGCAIGSKSCVPMLVNLDTDPGETQLLTRLCANSSSLVDPRCYTAAQLAPIVKELQALYDANVNNSALWTPSQIHKGSNAATRFPCCDPTCTPRPYCCKCGKGQAGPAAAVTEQHERGYSDPDALYEQFLGPELRLAGAELPLEMGRQS